MLRSKHSGWTWESRRTPFVGGGGGGGQTTSTSYQTNVPEYARPYVETMLNATQKQLFDTREVDGTPAKYDAEGNLISAEVPGRTEITGFRPYKPYSTNVEDYVAGFSPLQRQSFSGMAGMRPAEQLGTGTNLATTAGLGSLGLGAQAAMAGQNYAQMATSPQSMQAYMSPYMQNVVDVQKQAALRDYAMAMPALQAQAVGQGAFGGNRLALQQAEAGRGLMSQLQGIQASGTQQAFQQAQQAQQFGSQLGLQGLGTGLQGYGQAIGAAGQLGQLGQTQYGQQMGILEGLNRFGGQQQALEQQKINQAVQDWANAQQYPLMQLGVMSNMLRGLPMQAATTQQYVAQPNPLTQAIGTVGALGYLGKAYGKEGGLPSEFEQEGGIKSYNVGGAVKGKLYDMSPEDLQDYINETSSPIAKQLAKEVLRDKVGKASGGIVAFQAGGSSRIPEFAQDVLTMPQGDLPVQREESKEEKIMREYRERQAAEADRVTPYQQLKNYLGKAQEENLKRATVAAGATPTPAPAPTATPAPVVTPAAPAPAPASAPAPAAAPAAAPAPSGIKTAPAPAATPAPSKSTLEQLIGAKPSERSLEDILDEEKRLKEKYVGPDKARQERRSELMAERASAKDEAKRQDALRLAQFFAGWASTPGNTIVAGMQNVKAHIPDILADKKEQRKYLNEINKSIANLDEAARLEELGDFEKARKIKENEAKNVAGYYDRLTKIGAAQIGAEATVKAAGIRAEAGGGGDDKMLNNLITRRTAIQGKINDVKKENKILVMTADMANPNNDPRIQAMKDDAQTKLNEKLKAQGLLDELKQVNGLIDQYSKVQTVGTASGQSGAAAPAPNVVDFSKLPK